MAERNSDLVRSYIEQNFVGPARREGRLEFSVVAGEVHRALGLSNRVPLVCQALRSKQLLTKNALELKSEAGPPSGLSTTMVFTYRFVSPTKPTPSSLRALVGIGKSLWNDWGGGEAFLTQERAQFHGNHKE